MKRNLFTIMLAFLVAFGANAQNFGLASAKNSKIDQNTKKITSTMTPGLRSGKAVFLSETFDADIPATWTINNTGTGTLPGWFWESTDSSFPFTGFAIIDSDANGSGNNTVGELISPAFDNSAAALCNLDFDARYNDITAGGGDMFTVDVWDGTAWQNVLSWDEDHGDASTPEHVTIDITAYANAACQVRFYYADAGWDWYVGIDNVSVSEPEPNDLGVDAVSPTFVMSGSTVTPQVTVQNYGSADQATWSVQLTDGAGYDQTVADAATITAGSVYVVDFPDWTPADGTYTLTATVTLSGDANAANDVMAVTCVVAGLSEAYGGNTSDGIYSIVDLANGGLTDIGAIGSSPFPMSEEFNGTAIYRVYSDMTFGTVAPDGSYTNSGTLTGFSGTPTGLAWDWDNNVMYAMVLDGSNASHLCTLDIGSLALTEVGATGSGMFISIDFADDGYIYGPSIDDDTFYKVDPATGAATSMGAIGIDLNYGQDVSFNAADGMMYSITCGAAYKFGTYDLATGAFTEIADMNGKQYATFVITNIPEVTYNVTFNVDMNGPIGTGDFIVGTDTVSVTGDFAGWTEPGTDASLFLTDADVDGIYTYSTNLANGDYAYKYFKNLGWTGGEWDGDPNRVFTVADADVVLDNIWGTTSVQEISSDGIKVFPNPSNGVFNINVENDYNLEVFDITGRVINSGTLTGNTSIELNTAGIYFLRFSNEEGSYTQKVIVK